MSRKARKATSRQLKAKAKKLMSTQPHEAISERSPRHTKAFIVNISQEDAQRMHRPYSPRVQKEPELLEAYVKPRYGTVVKQKRYNVFDKS